jgi:NitT/TauT family transport system substrate-binding protein
MIRHLLFWAGAWAVIISLLGQSGCQRQSSTPPTPITVQLKWNHSAQFAGLYAAQDQGYYAEEQLDVRFLEGGGIVDLITPVVNGAADFGMVSGMEVVLGAAGGDPIQAIAVIYRRTPFVYFASTDSGINRPEDFAGKTIQVPPRSRPIFYTILSHVGLTPQDTIESQQTGLAPFYAGEVDVAVGYITTQVPEVRRQGYDLNVIFPDDYGVHIYDDTLFTTSDLIANNPDLALRFVRATLRGWTYALEHPDEAAALVQQYNPEANVANEIEALVASVPYVNTGEDYIGWMSQQTWNEMAETFRQHGVLTRTVEIESIYTMQFLEEIYRAQP